MEVQEFVMAAEIAFERLMTPTKGLRPSVMEEPLGLVSWSFKDLGLHLSGWSAGLLRQIEAVYHGKDFSDLIGPKCVGVEAGCASGMPLKRVMNEMRVTHSAVVEAARRVDWTKLDSRGHIPVWLEEGIIGHYELHRAEVEPWAVRMHAVGLGPMTQLPVK